MPRSGTDKRLTRTVICSVLAVSLSVATVLGYALWRSGGYHTDAAIGRQVEQALAEHGMQPHPR